MRNVLSILLLSIGFASPPAFAQLHSGENLLQPMPLPEDQWTATQSTEGKMEMVTWTKADGGDRVKTIVMLGSGGYPVGHFMDVNFKGGRESCKSFESKVLDESPINGFGRALWLGNCTQPDGAMVAALWLYISGKDSSYALFRQWNGTPTAAALDQWVAYFKAVKVCDTRKRRNAPCEDPVVAVPTPTP